MLFLLKKILVSPMPIIASQSYSSQAAPTAWNFRDLEYLSQSKKRSEMPQFSPNAYQQCQVRCDNREQFDFLIDVLYNREAVQEFLKKHSADKIEEKNRCLGEAIKASVGPLVENLSKEADLNLRTLNQHSEALQRLLSQPPTAPLFPQKQVLTQPQVTDNQNSILAAQEIETSSSQNNVSRALTDLFPNEEEQITPSEADLKFMYEKFSMKTNKTKVDQDKLRKFLKEAKIQCPANLHKMSNSNQFKDLVYSLTVHKLKQNSPRYENSNSTLQPFIFKKHVIVTTYANSLELKAPKRKFKQKPKSSIKFFRKQCFELDTSDHSLKNLVMLLSKHMYNTERIKKGVAFFEPQLDVLDVFFLAQVLALLFRKCLTLHMTTKAIGLFHITSCLFNDIVEGANLNENVRSYMVKHRNILTVFKNLSENFKNEDEESLQNSWLYYMFSVFCHHGYVGQTQDMDRRKSNHVSRAQDPNQSSLLFFVLRTIGIEHFTFFCIRVPANLRKPLNIPSFPGPIPF